MNSLEKSIENLRKAGLRITPQRRAILEVLENNPLHPSAEAIYEEIKHKLPDTSFTTIYNTLKELKDLGELNVVQNINESSNRYDPNTEEHNHLYCLYCGRIVDITDDLFKFNLDEDKRSGFQILKKQVTFYGICPDCQLKRNNGS
jgi:Fur family peroxide stress response transcriptional regulator